MVKSYAKFAQARSFGVVASATSNIIWSTDTTPGASRGTGAGKCVVPANEEVLCWDVKKGELLSRWRDSACKSEVTSIAGSKTDGDIYAVGYADGTIRLWDSKTATIIVSFNGHRSAVTALVFDPTGTRLASGSKDTNIIVWDLIAEVGLYRLRGHKDAITGLQFLSAFTEADDDEDLVSTSSEGWLVSTGKDTYIKLWELTNQHCVETHVAHMGECWAMGVSPDGMGLITAGNEGELKVWTIDRKMLTTAGVGDEVRRLVDKGCLYRQSKERAQTIVFHPNAPYVAVNGSDRSVEIFRMRSETEVQKVMSRKRKRKREKEGVEDTEETEVARSIAGAGVDDLFVQHTIIRTPGKARSIHWAHLSGSRVSKSLQLTVSMTNNALEMYNIPAARPKEKKKEKDKDVEISDYTRLYAIEIPGHRTDVRAISLSSDDRMLASASNGTLKVWNVKTSACIRTFECGYALCCAFLPGDKIVVVGTKSGELELFDVASAVMIESVQAHEREIWSLHVHPDGRSVVSGSADKTAKFWKFEIVQEEVLGTTRTTPRLRLAHTRTLKLNDDILSLRFTPNGILLAVALLDNTVKVFFTDSLKLLHSLHGHKLPVLSISISSNSKLIATSSADKNVRLWGLDFGDCHKSFFAHTDSVMSVEFESTGHNFFSASKDGVIKYWDGDKFENIMKLDGHKGEIWAMCVGKSRREGEGFVVSASHDRSMRVWEETDDQIFLEEEREKELEELYESTLTASLDKDGDEETEATSAGKQTVETLMAGERIIEALDLGMEDLEIVREYEVAKSKNQNMAPPSRHIVFTSQSLTAEEHVYNILSRIKPSHMQDALLILPFSYIPSIFTFLEIWAHKERNTPLTTRTLLFLLATHHSQIIASKTLKSLLDGIREGLRRGLGRQKDEMGFNLAGVRYLRRQVEERGMSRFDDVETYEKKIEENKCGRKRVFASLA